MARKLFGPPLKKGRKKSEIGLEQVYATEQMFASKNSENIAYKCQNGCNTAPQELFEILTAMWILQWGFMPLNLKASLTIIMTIF